MVSREEYKNFINKLVSEDVNNENLQYLKKGYEGWAVFMIVVSFFMIFFGVVTIFTVSIVGLLLVMIGASGIVFSIIRFVRSSKAIKYYEENYKEKIIDYLLSGYKHSFYSDSYIDKNIFRKSQFAGGYETYSGSDLLVINIPNDDGSESNVNLSLCDLILTKTEKDDDGDSRTVTVYAGVFGYIEFPFEFKCILGIDDCYHKKGVKMEQVKLEDINFNKKFKIYSSDQIEARYILTPDMMSKLLYLEDKFKGLQITLVDNKMYIGACSVNLFEIKSVRNNDVRTLFEDFYDQIESILNIVNEIKNNNKIFKM